MVKMLQKKELKALIELCKKGDKKAQQNIFDLKKDELFAVCKRYASNSIEAEDMFIEGFTKILNNINTYANGDFDAWTKRIVINTCINIYHKENKRKQNEITTDEFYENEDIESPERFSNEDLYYCMEQLNNKQRTIFNLFVIDGYKTREIATLLDTSDDTVRTTIHRTKIKLKQLLEDLERKRNL